MMDTPAGAKRRRTTTGTFDLRQSGLAMGSRGVLKRFLIGFYMRRLKQTNNYVNSWLWFFEFIYNNHYEL
jgi:hypothetical protein